eukprot:Tamp_10836.p2 GENE.Tamp_10836~~Tamp_10836.p2  ORF type:complete len:245 (-),score=35.85 Tamp_10836:1254-1937(-)
MQQARSLGRARRGWHTGTAALLLMLSCICALRSASSTRLARLLDLRGAQGPVAGGGGGSGRCSMAFGGAGRLTPLRGGDDTSGRGDAPVGGMTVLSFQVDVPEHHKAARVKVVGDHDVLGAWNSEFGFELKRLPGHPSVWRGNVQVPAAGKNIVKIEYKYVLEKENEAHTIDTVWETGIANHKVAISEEVHGQMLLVKDKGFNVEEKMRVVVPVPMSGPRNPRLLAS